MTLLITAVITAALYLIGQAHYGLGACALIVAACMLWWDGQPGRSLDQDL